MAFEPTLVSFASRMAMAERLADVIEAQLGRSLAEQGTASLAASGGSTPADLYRELSMRSLVWSGVRVVPVDERWVPPGSPGSNETLVRSTLIQNRAADAVFIGLWTDADSPADGLEKSERRLEALRFPLDVVVLGMGTDGHTASWFPDCAGLERALAERGPRLAAITAKPSDVTGDYLDRMTLTLGAISGAKVIVLLIVGKEKRAAFDKALCDGPVSEMPVRAILAARPDLRVCWAP
jgi:6-phosphogluconolactonase